MFKTISYAKIDIFDQNNNYKYIMVHKVLHPHVIVLKIGFLVAGGGFYFYYIHQGNKSDKERKIVRQKVKF